MATPDIGTTISDGYAKGIDRLSSGAPSIGVLAVVVGVITAVVVQLQYSVVGITGTGFSTGDFDLSSSDNLIYFLLSAVSVAVQIVVGFAGVAVVAGTMHKVRHGGPDELADPGGIIPQTLEMAGRLMPKLALIEAGICGALLVTGVSTTLGALVMLVVGIALFIFLIRWYYAPVIAGAGELTGDAAYARSADAVEGSWWGTLGVWIVIGLATTLPIAIVASIVGVVLPGVFLSAFAQEAILMLGTLTIFAASLESAWAQIEAAPSSPDSSMPPPNAPAFTTPTPTPPPAAPLVPPATPESGTAGPHEL